MRLYFCLQLRLVNNDHHRRWHSPAEGLKWVHIYGSNFRSLLARARPLVLWKYRLHIIVDYHSPFEPVAHDQWLNGPFVKDSSCWHCPDCPTVVTGWALISGPAGYPNHTVGKKNILHILHLLHILYLLNHLLIFILCILCILCIFCIC